MTRRTAIVTGANRGIGLEICRQLARLDHDVVLCARDIEKGEEARLTLEQEGLTVRTGQLDVADDVSIERFVAWALAELGRIDVLINNAGISIDDGDSSLTVPLDTIRETVATNVYGPLLLCQRVIPSMLHNNHGRIVNVSSGLGAMSGMGSGYPAYRLSKLALNGMTRILADDVDRADVLINAMCPGWVRTDMGGRHATRGVEQGADTAVWLATLPPGGPTGRFFRDRREIAW